MELLQQALRAGHKPVARDTASAASALVVGGGGALGSALVEQALASGRYRSVRVLVDEPITPGLRGFEALPARQLQTDDPLGARSAFVVFDRVRAANGREAVFHRPQPDDLARLGAALHRGGVQRLLVVLPHAPALLPHALRRGLASLDEQALAAQGFEQLVIVRPAQSAPAGRHAGGRLQRLAHAFLAQLHWLLPDSDQPVRAHHVAALALSIEHHLDEAHSATRVAPPELVWLSAQPASDRLALVRRWLADGHVPAPASRRRW